MGARKTNAGGDAGAIEGAENVADGDGLFPPPFPRPRPCAPSCPENRVMLRNATKTIVVNRRGISRLLVRTIIQLSQCFRIPRTWINLLNQAPDALHLMKTLVTIVFLSLPALTAMQTKVFDAPTLDKMTARFAPTDISADPSALPSSERTALLT